MTKTVQPGGGNAAGHEQGSKSRKRVCALNCGNRESRWWGLLWTKILYLHRERHRDINHYRLHQPEIEGAELKVYRIIDPLE